MTAGEVVQSTLKVGNGLVRPKCICAINPKQLQFNILSSPPFFYTSQAPISSLSQVPCTAGRLTLQHVTSCLWLSVDPHKVVAGKGGTGGNLAAVLCHRLARQEVRHLPFPCAQALIYPTLQMADFNLPPHQQNHAVPILLHGWTAVYFYSISLETCPCAKKCSQGTVPPLSSGHAMKSVSPLPAQPLNDSHMVSVNVQPRNMIKRCITRYMRSHLQWRMMPPSLFKLLSCGYDVVRNDWISNRMPLLNLRKRSLEQCWIVLIKLFFFFLTQTVSLVLLQCGFIVNS